MQVAALNAILTANTTQFVAGMSAASAATKNAGSSIKSTGASLTRNLAVPMALVGAASIKMAMDYETSLFKMQGLAGLTATEMGEMDEAIRQISSETATGPRELAEAMYYIASSGIQGAAAVDLLRASAMGAVAGLGDVQTVADAATSAVNAYGIENLSGAEAVNVMTGAVRLGKAEADEIAAAMGRVIPIAAQMGISFTDVGAAVAAMTRVGLSGAVSVTALRAVLSTIANPTVRAREALAEYGTSIDEIRSIIEEQGLLPAMLHLSDTLGGNDEAITSVFGNVRALVGALALMGESAETARQVFEEMHSDTNFLGEAFDAVSQTSAFQMKQAMADMEMAAVDLGTALMPVAAAIVTFISTIVSGFSSLPGPIQSAIAVFVGIGVALGPVIWIIGNFVTAIGTIGPAIGAAVMGFTYMIDAAIATNPALMAVVGAIAAVVAAFAIFQNIGSLTGGPDVIGDSVTKMADAFLTAARTTGDAASGISQSIASMLSAQDAADMDAAGVSIEELTTALMGSGAAWDDFVAGLEGTAMEDAVFGLQVMRDAAIQTADGMGHLETIGALPDVAEDATAGMEDLGDATYDAKAQADALAAAWANMDNTLAIADAMIAAEQGVRDLATAFEAAGEEGGITRDEMLDLQSDMVGLVGTLRTQAEALATNADGTIDVAGAQRVLHDSVVAVGDTLTGPMHDAWMNYTRDIRNVPDEARTVPTAPGIMQRIGEFFDLGGAIKKVPKSHNINVTSNVGSVLSAWQALPAAIRYASETANSVNIPAGIAAPHAVGGPVSAGQLTLVGEHGPELFVPSGSGSVVANGTAQMAANASPRSASGGGGTTVVEARINERSLARAIAHEVSLIALGVVVLE